MRGSRRSSCGAVLVQKSRTITPDGLGLGLGLDRGSTSGRRIARLRGFGRRSEQSGVQQVLFPQCGQWCGSSRVTLPDLPASKEYTRA